MQRIEVGLSFSADTTKARQELEKLKSDLSNTLNSAKLGGSNSPELNKAIEQATKLRGILDSATDISGKLNLTKFTRELDKSGMSMSNVASSLNAIGANGAFVSLAQQIQGADSRVQIFHGNVKKFMDGLKNTAMWTLQSNAIHAVQSALQGAYSYAQQLNKGLTDIAIVSDLNTQQLTEFAKTANRMAQDLSANTKDVVSGALIYYQAGLSDEEVLERTETTIKLAQTSGESAEQISSYMTAIWNNFYDGSKSVEYYADAISYLGAVTAASNADIAEGMQSFAATAETVGLSFEYGASALTLLRDVTQQSASTIGNSLKTIFARLSSVKQGETLEDGVDLTKYSQALENVGVKVVDVNGDLRNMDNILDDLAGRWDGLNNAQKAALAQTVGGVRQYNNLISLMDNYERFQELVSGAQGSEGYLQNQADEYAESWEAAKNRLTSAWQGIYDQLINDKFIIQLTNFFTGLVKFIGQVIDGAGGLKGVLALIVSIATTINPRETAIGLQNLVDKINELRDALNGVAESNNKLLQQQTGSLLVGNLPTDNERIWIMANKLDEAQKNYIENLGKATLAESAIQRAAIERYAAEINYALRLDKELNDLKVIYQDLKDVNLEGLAGNYKAINDLSGAQTFKEKQAVAMHIRAHPEEYGLDEVAQESLNKIKLNSQRGIDDFFTYLKTKATLAQGELDAQLNASNFLNNLKTALGVEVTDEQLEHAKQVLSDATNEFKELPKTAEDSEKLVKGLAQALGVMGEKGEEAVRVFLQSNQYLKNLTPKEKEVTNWSKISTDLTRAVSSATAFGSAMNRIVDGAKDGTLTVSSLASSIASMAYSGMSLLKLGGDYGLIPKFLMGPWGLVGLTLVAGLIKGASIAIQRFKDSLPENQLVAANEALKEQQELLNKVNSEYEETNNALDKLSNADTTLNKLTRGTAEWTQAVYDNNQAVLDLLANYGLLSDPGMYADVKGYLSLTDTAIARIKELQNLRQQNAMMSVYAAQSDVANKRSAAAAQRVKGIWDIKQQSYATGVVSDMVSMNMQGDYEQQATESMGEYGMSQKRAEEIVAALAKGTFQFIGDDVKVIDEAAYATLELNDAEKQLIETSAEFQDALKTATKETQDAFKDEEIRNKQLGEMLIDQIGGNVDIPDYLQGLVATSIGEKYSNQYTTTKAQLDEMTGAGLWDQYSKELKELGYNYVAGEKKFYNASGEEVNGELLRRALANQIVTVALANPDTITEAINNVDETAKADAKADWDAGAGARAEAERNRVESARSTGADSDAEVLGLKADTVAAVSKEVGYLVDAEQKLDKENRKFSDSTFKNEGALKKLAVAAEQTQEGFDELEKGYSDWYKAIKGKDPLAAAQAMDELKDALADIMNISDELTGSEYGLGEYFGNYITEHQDTVLAALKGDQDAIIELQHVAAQDLIMQLDTDQLLVDTETAKSIIDDHMALMQEALADGRLKLGAVDDTDLLASLSNTINSLTDDVNVAQQILARMGYDAEVEQTEVTDSQQYWVPPRYSNQTVPGASPSVQTTLEEAGHWEDVPSPVTHHALRIKTADYVGGGNILGAKGGTGAGKTRAKNATTGKGGGGGSSKTKTKEADRYHEITSQLEQTAHALEMVNTQEDQAYGPDKLALMDEKIKLLEQETDQYQQLYDEAKAYYDADKAHLTDTYGAQFNADGSIANYDAWYGQFLDKYNSGQMDDDAWKAFEDAIKKYEDSLKHLNDAEKSVQDNLIEIFNQKLEKIEYKLKYLNTLIDKDIDYLDFMIEQLDKNMYSTADVLALIGDRMGKVLEKAENERTAIAGILGEHKELSPEEIQQFLNGQLGIEDIIGRIGQLTDEEIEDLQNHQTALLNYSKELIRMREESYAKISESIGEFNDQIERQIDIVNDAAKVMKHWQNIVDIVGKDTLGVSDEMLADMDRVSVLGAKSSLEISTDQLEKNKQMLEDLYKQRAEMAETASEEDKRLMDEEIKKQEDEVRRLTESWASSWEEALHTAEEAFKNSIKRATDTFSQAMAGSLGNLENFQEAFDQQKQLNERYLPAYERIYELNKLTRDVAKSIDSTNNIAGKERLLKLQQEILERQESGAEITEYEVGMLQRRLELEQARIAMEEAQNTKNMVRMTRDNEGNWSYTYTADASKTAEAEQEYEDKLYNLKKFNQESLAEFEAAMWKAVEDYKNSIADMNYTDEERAQKIHEFQQQWVEHNGKMFQMALDDANMIIDEYGGGLDDLQNKWSDTVSGQISDYASLEEVMDNFNTSSATLMESVKGTYDQWKTDYTEIFGAAGTSVKDFARDAKEAIDETIKKMVGDGEEDGGAVGAAKDFATEMKNQFDDILSHIKTWLTGEDGYFNQIDAIVEKNGNWYTSIQDLITEYGKLEKAQQEQKKEEESSGSGGSTPTPFTSTSDSGSGSDTTTTYQKKKETVTPQKLSYGAPVTISTHSILWSDGHKTTEAHTFNADGVCTKCGYVAAKEKVIKNNKYGITTMASGGYTGAWGPEGRMAMLHEKELVLNDKDTANMLKTVGFVRDITQMLSLNASSMSTGLGALASGVIGSGGSYLDQNVTIHAEFPNATNHSEIEEAFNNLIGLASQYAGRKQ